VPKSGSALVMQAVTNEFPRGVLLCEQPRLRFITPRLVGGQDYRQHRDVQTQNYRFKPAEVRLVAPPEERSENGW